MTPQVGPEQRWWAAPELVAVWQIIADALERRGRQASGVVTVDAPDVAVRRALAGLVGAVAVRDRTRVDLLDLDERLRRRAGLGLVEAAEDVLGRALVDRPRRRADSVRRREAPLDVVRQWWREHPEQETEWARRWLEGVRRDGLLTRHGEASVRDALAVLAALHQADPAVAPTARSRTQLGAAVLGDAHALDSDRPVATLVLRALAVREGVPPPRTAGERRDLWESAGVLVDSVSATALTWGLTGPRPRHLTWWDLDEVGECLAARPPRVLLVCENPRVLEAAAEGVRDGRLEAGDLAVVCTSGRPNLVTGAVLDLARARAWRAWYHGDFDWPGVRLANAALARWHLEPVGMGADDYLTAPARLPLTGQVVEPSWSAELGAAMRRRGLAVHEETVLDGVLDGIAGRAGTVGDASP